MLLCCSVHDGRRILNLEFAIRGDVMGALITLISSRALVLTIAMDFTKLVREVLKYFDIGGLLNFFCL